MPPVEAIQAIVSGGIAVILGIGIWAFATGRIRVGSLVDREMAKKEAECEQWKALAQSFTPEQKRQNDLLATAVDIILDGHSPLPRRAPR